MRIEETKLEDSKKILEIMNLEDEMLLREFLEDSKSQENFRLFNYLKGLKIVGIISIYSENETAKIGFSYIKPKYRGRGFEEAVTKDLLNKFKKDGVEIN